MCQRVNRFFTSSFENEAGRIGCTKYYLLKVGTKDYKVIVDERNFFNQPVRNDTRTYENMKILSVK